jgi:glycosyltransferase involved in cell wall biosynthesis
MYKICILVDKFYRFGGGEIFLEDLILNSSIKLSFKYLISLNKIENVHQNPSLLPIEVLEFNDQNIKKASEECDVLIFWGRVLSTPGQFKIKHKIMWVHSDYNVNYFLQKAEDYATHYIACSTSVKEAIKKKNCSVIYPGIDEKRYKKNKLNRQEIRSILGFKESDFVVGQFCRFEKFKNIPFLINSVSKILNLKVLLMGHGNELNEIIKLCEEKIFQRFQYIYYSNVENISNFYSSIDAFCLPSLGEGYARVQWESAMFGVPFIGTNVGGVKDGIINGVSGFIIKNEEEFKSAIKKLQNEENKRKVTSKAYNFFTKEGSIDSTIKKIENLLEKLLNDRKKLYI